MDDGYRPPANLSAQQLRGRAEEYRSLAGTILAADIRSELLWMAYRFEVAAAERSADATVGTC
jgi:hypothetical protein